MLVYLMIDLKCDTVDGKDVLRSDLDVVIFKDYSIVIHINKGMLCVLVKRSYKYAIYEPIKFKSADEAWNWVNSGCISEIQESFSELSVSFRTEMIVYRT